MVSANFLSPIQRPKVVRFHANVCIDKDIENYEVDVIKEEITEKCSIPEIENLKLENGVLKKTILDLEKKRCDGVSLETENAGCHAKISSFLLALTMVFSFSMLLMPWR